MSTRIDQIFKLIQEEAKNRAGIKGYVNKLYDVKLDVDLRLEALVKTILDRERENAKRKEVGRWPII